MINKILELTKVFNKYNVKYRRRSGISPQQSDREKT